MLLPSARRECDERHDAFRWKKERRSPYGERPRAREEEELRGLARDEVSRRAVVALARQDEMADAPEECQV